jgi:hypothetical protein
VAFLLAAATAGRSLTLLHGIAQIAKIVGVFQSILSQSGWDRMFREYFEQDVGRSQQQ